MNENRLKPIQPAMSVPGYRYPSPDVPISAIRRFARQIGERFHPDKVILFGSFAYGQPHQESDVDLLVVMPASNEIDQAIRVTLAFESPFSLDLIVRTPENLRRGLEEGDWFHCIISLPQRQSPFRSWSLPRPA
jgi:uncharacterized protein